MLMSEKKVLLVELLAEKDVDAEEAECWFAFEVATALPCCAPLVANNFSPASCSQRDTGSTLEYCRMRDKNNKIFSATHGGGEKASHKTVV